MKIETAHSTLAGATKDQRDALENAHWRYMAFAGLISDDEYQKQAEEDRARYPHLLKFTPDGTPVISDQRTADFMVAVTGLPRDWCLAWDESDFYETHGVTSDEAVQLGHV